MTVSEKTGNLFDPSFKFDAIGHGVNCYGAMGAGIAVAFKHTFPEMHDKYKEMCDGAFLKPGMAYPWLDYTFLQGEPLWIYNIASQYRPGPDADIDYLEAGLDYVKFHMRQRDLAHLGLPRIGAGIGGLEYPDVLRCVERVFNGLDIHVTVVSLEGA